MKRVVVVVVMVACVVGVVACGASRGEPGVSVSSSVSVKPVPSVWPSSAVSTFSPVKSADQVAAEEVVAEYFRLKNQIQADHSADLAPLEAILTGALLEGQIALIEEDRENNIIQQGSYAHVITGSKVSNKGKVDVTACTDTSGTDLVDAETGESVLDADRNLRRIWVIKVVKENEVWKLSDFTTQETASCEF